MLRSNENPGGWRSGTGSNLHSPSSSSSSIHSLSLYFPPSLTSSVISFFFILALISLWVRLHSHCEPSLLLSAFLFWAVAHTSYQYELMVVKNVHRETVVFKSSRTAEEQSPLLVLLVIFWVKFTVTSCCDALATCPVTAGISSSPPHPQLLTG